MTAGDDRRQHGDPFPLNVRNLREMAANAGSFEPQRALWVGDSLNRLALHDLNSKFSPILSSEQQDTAVQRLVMQRVVDSLQLYGEPCEGMTPESALKDLRSADVSYSGVPSNLASYDPSKLKVLRSNLKPKRITNFLPPEPAKLIEHYDSQILLPEVAQPEPFSPYWDPKLRFSRQARLEFILGLHQAGLVSLRRTVKSFIGAFFVKKKDPNAIRMVLDCRGTNRLHQPPPVTRLGSARCYGDLLLDRKPCEKGWGMEADVCDAFYNFSIPELTHYFGFNHPLTAMEWQELGVGGGTVYDPETRGFVAVQPGEILYPCVEAVPMGWSWALFLCNEAVVSIARTLSPWPEGVFRERKPTPQLDEYRTSLGVYVDNMTILGAEYEDVKLRSEKITEAFKLADVPITWTQTEPSRVLESVGCVLDFENGVLHNKPRRVWRFHLASLALLKRRKLGGKILQIWAGHFTSLCSHTPWGLACLQHVYRFIEAGKERRTRMWASVRREIKLAAALVWMTWRDLSAPYASLVEVGDSSTSGYAMTVCNPGDHRIRAAAAVHEKWRFVAMPETLKQAANLQNAELFQQRLEQLLGAHDVGDVHAVRHVKPAALSTTYAHTVVESLQEGSWLSTSSIRSQLRAPAAKRIDVEIPALVAPLDDFFANEANYRVLWARRWRNTEEHINIKECRVALSSLRRASRVAALFGLRKLTLSDNLATVCALSKGRSSVYKMNSLCQTACAIQFGCGIVWHLRHIESKRNVADAPSRLFQKKHLVQRAAPAGAPADMAQCGGQSSQSSSSSKQSSRIPGVHGGVFPETREKFFLELFAGTGRLSAAVKSAGGAVLEPVEISKGVRFDLRRRQTQRLIIKWIEKGIVGFVHLGTPLHYLV